MSTGIEFNKEIDPQDYKLDHSVDRGVCPACLDETFVPYVDSSDNHRIAGFLGKCVDAGCGYEVTPQQYKAAEALLVELKKDSAPKYVAEAIASVLG